MIYCENTLLKCHWIKFVVQTAVVRSRLATLEGCGISLLLADTKPYAATLADPLCVAEVTHSLDKASKKPSIV
jgi:hypothetical protein